MLFWKGDALNFTKPALTIEDQVALLQRRGLEGDATRVARRLRAVNYYRLSAYWHTFRDRARADERFLPGTHIDVVWGRYIFDRALRVLVMDAIERFEIATRSRLSCELALLHGPFGYAQDSGALFPRDPMRRQEFIRHLKQDLDLQRREPFINHFHQKYGDAHPFPPVWVAVEVLRFGGTVSLFNGSADVVQRAVADTFQVAPRVFKSWLLTLNLTRNVCAHHGRLWNRELANKPLIPRRPEWVHPVQVGNGRIFGVLTILAHTNHLIAPNSGWAARVRSLLAKHPDVPRAQMGFPEQWERCPVWRRAWREQD